MSKIEFIEEDRLNSKEMGDCRGGKRTEIPVEGTEYHTDTDCYQYWEVHHSFLGIKWTEKKLKRGGCSHMPSGGNRCPECCEKCQYKQI